MKQIYFAHAGEEHETVIESASHSFEADPLIASVIAILSAALIVALVHIFIKKPSVTVLTTLACLFVIGVFAYSALPIISAICITLGFILSLGLAFGGILHGK